MNETNQGTSTFRPAELLRGLGPGDCVVDGTRTFGGRLFQLKSHVERLLGGADELSINCRWRPQAIERSVEVELEKRIHEAARLNQTESEYEVKFGLSASGPGLADREAALLVAVRCIDERIGRLESKYMHGCDLTVVSQLAIPSSIIRPQIKSRGSAHWRMAELEAEKCNPGSWALLLHSDGVVSEGVGLGASGWNIHFVKGKNLISPTELRAVDGIAASYVRELAGGLGLRVERRDFQLNELLEADEVFITSSWIGLMKIRSIGGIRFNLPADGGWSGKLSEAFQIENPIHDLRAMSLKSL